MKPFTVAVFSFSKQSPFFILQDIVDLSDERDQFVEILLDGCLLTQVKPMLGLVLHEVSSWAYVTAEY